MSCLSGAACDAARISSPPYPSEPASARRQPASSARKPRPSARCSCVSGWRLHAGSVSPWRAASGGARREGGRRAGPRARGRGSTPSRSRTWPAVNSETAMTRSDRSAASRACSGEAAPELRRGVVAGEDEQIVEGGHRAAEAHSRQPLVQPVETGRRPRRVASRSRAAACSWRAGFAPGSGRSGAGDSTAEIALRGAREPARTESARNRRQPPRGSPPGCTWRRARFSIG